MIVSTIITGAITTVNTITARNEKTKEKKRSISDPFWEYLLL